MKRGGFAVVAAALAASLGAQSGSAADLDRWLTRAAGVPTLCDAEWRYPAGVERAKALYDTVNRSIILRQEVCDRLHLMRSRRYPRVERRRFELAEAVFMLGHEIGHSRGLDERDASCFAVRRFFWLTARLAIPVHYATVLADFLVSAHVPPSCAPARPPR